MEVDFANDNYLVVGLGRTGLAVVEFLVARNANVTVTDSSIAPSQLAALQAKFPPEFLKTQLLLGAITVPATTTHIILSPGVPLSAPEIQAALKRGITVISDIELFAQVVAKPVLAVTGSNGKSTVTTLLGEMARASGISAGVGGNLGTPALALLDPKHQCYILELSSFQLESIYSLHTKVVTVLNISPDHMDRYPDVTAYQQAKLRIYNNAEYAVINREDALTAVPQPLEVATLSFGLDQPSAGNYGVVWRDNVAWLAKGAMLLMPTAEMAMLGAHNIANALAALAMGDIAGFDLDAMLATLRTFKGLEHRCEKIATLQDVLWVNDSKGTNVGATVAAIAGLQTAVPGKWIIVLGGLGKNADFTPLLEPVAKTCKAAILLGAAAPQLWDLLHNVLPCYRATDLADVVAIARKIAVPGDGVLLSPACASWDMFENYMQRGSLFRDQVLRNAHESATIN